MFTSYFDKNLYINKKLNWNYGYKTIKPFTQSNLIKQK
jgi:hypothetical protein